MASALSIEWQEPSAAAVSGAPDRAVRAPESTVRLAISRRLGETRTNGTETASQRRPGPFYGHGGNHGSRWRQDYHVRTTGVTGGGERSGRVVVSLPWEKLEFGTQYGGPLESPEGWPPLWLPEPGETLAALCHRVIDGDAFLQLVTARTSDRRPVPSLDGRRPADLTFAWWEKNWPERASDWPFEETLPRGYHRDRVYWRLVVEFFDRLRGGDLVMKARRMDDPEPDDPESPLEPVGPGRFRNPFMVLSPRALHGGWFRPEKWLGSEPPGLPHYFDLTVWPAEASETERETPETLVPEPQAPAEAPPYRTGTQGRPTSIILIASELERRRFAEQTLDTQVAEAKALVAWLKQTHPKAPPCTAKTIRTSHVTQRPLRLAVNEAKARKERLK